MPERTAGGHRLYSEEDLERLAFLGELVDRGHRISQIAGLTDRVLDEMVHGARGAAAARERIIAAAHAMAEERQESELRRAALELSASEFVEGVLLPVVRVVGRKLLRPGSAHDRPDAAAAPGAGDGKEAGDVREGVELKKGEEMEEAEGAGGTLDAVASYVAMRAIRRFTHWFLEITRAAWTVGVIAVRPAVRRGEAALWPDELSAAVAGIVMAQEGWDVRLIEGALPGPHLASALAAIGARTVVFVDRSLLASPFRGMRKEGYLRGRARAVEEGRLLVAAGSKVRQLVVTPEEWRADLERSGGGAGSMGGGTGTEASGTSTDPLDGLPGGPELVPGLAVLRRRVRRMADHRRSAVEEGVPRGTPPRGATTSDVGVAST